MRLSEKAVLEESIGKDVAVDAAALKRAREGALLTVRELVERAGVSRNMATNLKSGCKTVRPSEIRFCWFCGRSILGA